MNSWQIATTATAITGFADTAVGAGPMLFNVAAFDTDDGTPLPLYGDKDHPFTFSHGQGQSGDAPAGPGNMSWTDYSGDTNDNTNTVRRIIRGETSLDVTLDRGQYIGQHNNGQHADLFEEIDTLVVPNDIPVPIVDENGIFQGWATFHVTSASRSDKTVTGYFKSNFVAQRLTIRSCSIDVDCPVYLGSFTLKLVNYFTFRLRTNDESRVPGEHSALEFVERGGSGQFGRCLHRGGRGGGLRGRASPDDPERVPDQEAGRGGTQDRADDGADAQEGGDHGPGVPAGVKPQERGGDALCHGKRITRANSPDPRPSGTGIRCRRSGASAHHRTSGNLGCKVASPEDTGRIS